MQSNVKNLMTYMANLVVANNSKFEAFQLLLQVAQGKRHYLQKKIYQEFCRIFSE